VRAAGNPFIREGIRMSFSQGAMLRSYLTMAALLAVVCFFSWPLGSIALDAGSAGIPGTFSAVMVGLLACCAWISARSGAEGYSPETLAGLGEYATLTPVSLAALVAGKAAFGLLHTIFLLALGVPFMIASLAVSGVDPSRAGEALLVAGAFSFASRMLGLLLRALLGARTFLVNSLLFACGGLFLVVTILAAPALNPITALLRLAAAASGQAGIAAIPGAPVPFFAISVILDLLAAILFAAGAYAALAVTRARGRAGKGV